MQKWKLISLPFIGFITTAIVFSVLSSVTLLASIFLGNLGNPMNGSSFVLLITIVYFAGMPFGKVLGRMMKFHRNASLYTLLMFLVIIGTIIVMPYVHSLTLFLILRFIHGTASFVMEIYSIAYSFLFTERQRGAASAISISGIPAGVTLGSIVAVSLSIQHAFILIPALGVISLIPFVYLLRGSQSFEKNESSKTTYSFKFTWIYGLLWMTIAGFNLTLAVIIPLYIPIYSTPAIISSAMIIFGAWGAIATVLGGTIAYLLYAKLHGIRSLLMVGITGYAISIPGFILMYIHSSGSLILFGVFLIQAEALAISPIYSTPIAVYGKERVGTGTWEFSLIGSFGHIIAPLSLLPLALIIGYDRLFLFLIVFPVYGIVALSIIYRFISGKDMKIGVENDVRFKESNLNTLEK